MPVEPWNESGRVWEEDHGLLDPEQVARCRRFGQLKEADNLSRMRETYTALAIEPDHTRYGWIRVRA
jgi:hypothetical protein